VKKSYWIGTGIGLSILIVYIVITFSINQDQKNAFARKSVEYLKGNYLVTFSNGPTSKSWTIRSGKVTTSDKGYYYFWSVNGYVQVPITNTFIEEIK
jgi:hypothetical protein